MSSFKVKTLPGNTWPPIPGVLSQLWAAYLEVDRTQWLDPEEVEAGQLRQLRILLRHCIDRVPYYRRTLAAAGVEPQEIKTLDDFRRIPLLSRAAYRDNAGELRAMQLPEGTLAGGKSYTSGTTGVPIEVLQTNMVQLWWFAFYLRDIEWAGLDPQEPLVSIRNTGKKGRDLELALGGVKQPVWSTGLSRLIEMGPAYVMDIHQDIGRQMEYLREVNASYLLSYPANLEALASLIETGSDRLPALKAIRSISETLYPDVQERIEAAFGVPVIDLYSCAEAGYVASPCPERHGMHVHAENVLIEILDDNNRPCGPGETGRVVLTTLHNSLQPFIRYEIMDEAVMGPARCPCGRGLPLLSRTLGKARPMFRLLDGRLKSSSPLATGMRAVGGHRQYQIIQKAVDHVVVRLVRDSSWTEGHADRIRELVQSYLEAPVRVDVCLEERLEPMPSGKFQSVISELAPASG